MTDSFLREFAGLIIVFIFNSLLCGITAWKYHKDRIILIPAVAMLVITSLIVGFNFGKLLK
ncbi:MAG TPA: hypothetical protein P5089_02610 [Candidatus Portnoybacteria bacterium]|nr:hypothetical protein [Candidatus Portnoybacteria bacterium]